MKGVLRFFDKLEDRVRGKLSHYPIIYAVIGGVGVVLFWRGTWVTADYLSEIIAAAPVADTASTISSFNVPWWDGPLSFLVGLIMMLLVGVFVSNFIGNEIIITGLQGDKKISERTEEEMRHEVGAIGEIRSEVKKITEKLEALQARK